MNKLVLGAIAIGLFTVSCQKDENTDPDSIETSRVQVKNNNFDDRITYHDEPVESTGKTSNGNASFNYVANVTSPVVNGAVLSASGIAFQGNKAYISYHWNGAPSDYAGAIEVVDISQPTQPQIISAVYFTDTDLNEIYVQGNEVYTVGSRSLSNSGYDPNITSGAVVDVIRLQGGQLTNQVDEAPLPSYSGNSVFRKGNDLYVTSGNTGGGAFEVSLKNNQYLNITESDYYGYSKFGVDEGSMYVFLQGGPNAKLHVHNSNKFKPNNKTVINLANPTAPADGKAVLDVDFSNQVAYVSSGSYGLHAYDLSSNSGNATQSFNPNGPGFVNGVANDNFYVYAAKGSDGLYILDKNTFNVEAQFTYSGSANYVGTNGQNVFIANGTSGLKILSKN
ncbi:LVIVD repeat-containing protein [Salibacter halophilus]|uniref:DUF5074 domain-containing protein n=1 Tax=Salibacter halophilus TaxID=1803916 RepID=A0A6N6M847_9FLAO|nr:hypothetical protein [Salibacter halophilus]KAB1064931.1 hypothetical protein F3059_06140 [Salibacter halophilus]